MVNTFSKIAAFYAKNDVFAFYSELSSLKKIEEEIHKSIEKRIETNYPRIQSTASPLQKSILKWAACRYVLSIPFSPGTKKERKDGIDSLYLSLEKSLTEQQAHQNKILQFSRNYLFPGYDFEKKTGASYRHFENTVLLKLHETCLQLQEKNHLDLCVDIIKTAHDVVFDDDKDYRSDVVSRIKDIKQKLKIYIENQSSERNVPMLWTFIETRSIKLEHDFVDVSNYVSKEFNINAPTEIEELYTKDTETSINEFISSPTFSNEIKLIQLISSDAENSLKGYAIPSIFLYSLLSTTEGKRFMDKAITLFVERDQEKIIKAFEKLVISLFDRSELY